MKNQALISSKDKSEKLKCRLLQFFSGALRVNIFIFWQEIFKQGKVISKMEILIPLKFLW